jgi:D-sedoheptulose 7-phosphate isomerase
MSNLHELFARRLEGSLSAIASLREPAQLANIVVIAEALRERLSRGGTLYTCGNGGSAAEAMHLAEELIGRYRSNRRPYRAVCINSDATALTCIANDFGYDKVFARQCEALLTPNDCLMVFSTSGMSPNLAQALQVAQRAGTCSIGLLGRQGGDCALLCKHALVVANDDSAHIQEAHQVALHMICESLESP